MKEENIFSSIMKNIRIAGLTLATCKNKKNIKRSKYLNIIQKSKKNFGVVISGRVAFMSIQLVNMEV